MNSPGHRCSNRMFEWISTAMMLGIAATLLLSPKSIEFSAFRLMLDAGLTQRSVEVFFLMAGWLRIIALFANGRLPVYGPAARAFGALAGAFIWGQMSVALLGLSPVTGTIAPGVPVYFALVVGELLSCVRAVRDGRRYSDR